jgi:hypothetical protein
MIFFRKKKEEDIEPIKNLFESKKVPDELLQIPTEEKIPEVLENIGRGGIVEETVENKPFPEPELPKQEIPKLTPKFAEEKKPTFAPLFVKIDKYRSVLNTISDLKTTVIMIKNALALQKEVEGLRDENRRMMEAAINKIDKKIVVLDSEFLRPEGFEEEFPPQIYETEGLEGVVTDLKKQIEGLKSELQTIS